jgi:transcriptional regulator with XRE-family HTH domain
MELQAEAVVEALVTARQRKGWSQRELSQKAGIPQSHISRIESGVVDLKLTTLLEFARLLDLEFVMAPRQALTAVNAALREARADVEVRAVRVTLGRLNQIAGALRAERPDEPAVRRLTELMRDLYHLERAFQAPGSVAELERLSDAVIRAARQGPPALRRAVEALADLRSRLVHTTPDSQRPAYSLDDED